MAKSHSWAVTLPGSEWSLFNLPLTSLLHNPRQSTQAECLLCVPGSTLTGALVHGPHTLGPGKGSS